ILKITLLEEKYKAVDEETEETKSLQQFKEENEELSQQLEQIKEINKDLERQMENKQEEQQKL
ncbi:21521_t:CDS:1, partial [Dentiscutata erythropus]